MWLCYLIHDSVLCIPGSLSESETCSLPGCTQRKYVDPANNRVHDFCGRSHAFEAQKQGILVQTFDIIIMNSIVQ